MTKVNTAEAVAQELDRIASQDRDGLIRPEVVVEEASSNKSPLHAHFTWDDSVAAYDYRLHQARNLIRTTKIVREDPGPRYVNVTIQRENGAIRRGYVRTDRAVADPDLLEQVIFDAVKVIRSLRLKLSAFQRARPALEPLDTAIEVLQNETVAAIEER